MTKISRKLACLYSAMIDTEGDSSTIAVPKRESITPARSNRDPPRALLTSTQSDSETATASPTTEAESSPPSSIDQPSVTEDDVETETLGDQGDGIAKIDPGYVIIVPETAVDDRVAVRIDTAEANMVSVEIIKLLT